MFEDDYGGVMAARKLAREMQLKAMTNNQNILNKNVLQKAKVHDIIDSGVSDFKGYEDVMAKLLGKV